MDDILQSIGDAIHDFFVDVCGGMFIGIFDDANAATGDIASQVGLTPSQWNGSIFTMIQNLSKNVVIPIAGLIITFVLCYELITMITEKNNMHDIDTFMFFKYVFKSCVAVMLLSHVLNGTEEAERLFTQLKEEKLRTRELKNENMRLAEENDSLAEVVDFINMYDDESDLLNVSDIAIAYQMSAIEFNRLLCILGIQHRAYGTWILAPEYENCGYVRTDKRPTFYGEGFFIHTRWTHKGAAFLYNRLKENGILPVFDWIKQITITN